MHNGRLYAGTNEGLFYLDQVREYDNVEVLYRQPPSETNAGEKEEDTGAEAGENKRPVIRLFNRLFGKNAEEDTKSGKEEEPAEQVNAEPRYGTRTVKVLR